MPEFSFRLPADRIGDRCRSAWLLLAVCVVFGCDSESAGPGTPPPPTVTVARPLKQQIVEWDDYIGRLEATEFVEIRARVSGYLKSIHFDEGDIVDANDLLFVIDPRPFEADLNAARASVSAARSELHQARASQRTASAQLAQARARLNLARLDVNRVRSLRARNAATPAELDEAEAELLQAEAGESSGIAGVASAEAAIATATAAVEQAEALEQQAALNLNYTRIRAPIAGRISRHYVTAGNLISGGSAGSTLLTTITSIDPIHCTFDASEQQVLNYIRLAQSGRRKSSREFKNPVFLALDDETGFPHKGHMDFVDNRFDEDTATMRARCIFPNADQVLFPGMFARIRIPGSAPWQALMIPDAAVGTDQSEQYVTVVGPNDTVERRAVTLGPLVDGLRVVRSGLSADDRVVIAGLLQARPGQTVTTDSGTITAEDDGLPNDYQPLPPEEWLSPGPDPIPDELSIPDAGTSS